MHTSAIWPVPRRHRRLNVKGLSASHRIHVRQIQNVWPFISSPFHSEWSKASLDQFGCQRASSKGIPNSSWNTSVHWPSLVYPAGQLAEVRMYKKYCSWRNRARNGRRTPDCHNVIGTMSLLLSVSAWNLYRSMWTILIIGCGLFYQTPALYDHIAHQHSWRKEIRNKLTCLY